MDSATDDLGGVEGFVSFKLVRSFLSVLLVLAVLPWGAFASSHSHDLASGSDVRPIASDNDTPAVVEPRAEASMMTVAATNRERCRGTGLPGSACGPDMLASERQSDPPSDFLSDKLKAEMGEHRPGLTLPGVLDPPRSP